jgi:hypothetical protein
MKAVAYYRTRPSEPAPSKSALYLQREAVQNAVKKGGYTLVAEFIEREGEGDDEARPAYVAAVRTALAHKEEGNTLNVALLVASQAGIGSGEPFREPNVKNAGRLLHVALNASPIPARSEMALPVGARESCASMPISAPANSTRLSTSAMRVSTRCPRSRS